MAKPPLPVTARPLPLPPAGQAFALALVVFVLYAASVPVRSDALLFGNDVVPYAVGIASGDRGVLFHPNHLLAHLAAVVAMPFAAPLAQGPVTQALFAQVLTSALAGALATVAVWRTAHVLAGGAAAAVVALFFATACGNWLYGSVGETYLPATAAVAWLWSHAIVARARDGEPSAVRLAAYTLLAVTLRQDSVLALPALFVIVAPRRLASAFAGAGAAAVALYVAAWSVSRSPLGFTAWLRGVAEIGLFGATPDAHTVAIAALLTVGAHAWSVVAVALDVAGGRGPGLTALFAAAPLLVIAGALPWKGASRADAARRGASIGVALVLFALTRFAFFAWWQPTNLEYHAGTLPPLAWLVALGLARGAASAPRLALVAVGAAVAAIGNFALLIGPARGTEAARRAELALSVAGERGLVVALDDLAHYAHLRARDGRAKPELMAAAGAVVPGADPARLDALLATIAQARASGRTVVLALDLVTAEHLGMPPPPVSAEAAAALLSGDAERRADERGWLAVLRPLEVRD